MIETILNAAIVWLLFGAIVAWLFVKIFVGPDPEARDEREQA